MDFTAGQYSVQEDFLGLVSTFNTMGRPLLNWHQTIVNDLKLVGPWVKRFAGYTAALGNSAQYVHCKNHALNLACAYVTKFPIVCNALVSVTELCFFAQKDFVSDTKQQLQKWSNTHWSQHDTCLMIMITNLVYMCTSIPDFQSETDRSGVNAAVSRKSNGVI